MADDVNGQEEDVDPEIVEEIVLKYISGSQRDHKYKVHRAVQEAQSLEEREECKPNNWSSAYQTAMLEHFQSPKFLVSFIGVNNQI